MTDTKRYVNSRDTGWNRSCTAARPVGRRPRPVPGRNEWFFRSLCALLVLLSPRRATVIARAGVAVFGFCMLLPLLVSGVVVRPSAPVFVAATTELQVTAAYDLPRLPEPVARSRHVEPTQEPTPQPAPPATVANGPAVPIEITAVPASASGRVVTEAGYGPGLYVSQHPCR